MKKILITLLLVVGIQLQTLQAQKSEVLTNKMVIDLYKAGLGSETILSKIETSDCKFDVSTNGMLLLAKQKLPNEIIKAMVQHSSNTGPTTNNGLAQQKVPGNSSTSTIPKTAALPDLDFINIPHFLDKSTNTIKPLERSTVAVKAKVNLLSAMVPGSATPIVLKMDSAASPVRLPEMETVSFLINTGNNVPEIFGLYKMSASKKKREATWFNVSAFENKSDKDVIAFNYRKIRDGVYEVVPVSKLVKGEYCFVNKTSYSTYGGSKADVFAFGIQ